MTTNDDKVDELYTYVIVHLTHQATRDKIDIVSEITDKLKMRIYQWNNELMQVEREKRQKLANPEE